MFKLFFNTIKKKSIWVISLILFDVEIKDKKQISLLNKKLCDLDYM